MMIRALKGTLSSAAAGEPAGRGAQRSDGPVTKRRVQQNRASYVSGVSERPRVQAGTSRSAPFKRGVVGSIPHGLNDLQATGFLGVARGWQLGRPWERPSRCLWPRRSRVESRHPPQLFAFQQRWHCSGHCMA